MKNDWTIGIEGGGRDLRNAASQLGWAGRWLFRACATLHVFEMPR